MNEILNILKERNDINNTRQQTISKENITDNGESKTETEPQNDNQDSTKGKFLKIDGKNIFTEIGVDDICVIKDQYDKFKQSEDDIINENINKIMNKILDKMCNSNMCNDIFIISQNLCKQICKNNKIGKENIDNLINHLTGNNINNKNSYKSQTFLLTRNKCEIIGSILCYSYSKLHHKMKDMNKLIELRKTIIEQGTDVMDDFADYCKTNKVTDKKITTYWKMNRNNYIFSPEIIFLINRYSNVTEVEIDFNLFEQSLNDDEVKIQLIELTLLNINWLFNSLKSFKINFINELLQQNLYPYFTYKLNLFCSNIKENIKKNILTNDKQKLYKKKWNFVDFFKLEIHRLLNEDNSNNNLKRRKSAEFSCFFSRQKNLMRINTNVKRRTQLFNNDNFFESSSKLKNNKDKDKDKDEEVENYSYTIMNYSSFFELIVICLFSLNNNDNPFDIELIMNDSYMEELLSFFKNILGLEIDGIKDIFNIFDILLFNNKMNFLNKLKIEINSLDVITFDRLLNILYNNNKILNSINISFFSSDITYSPQFLYKICNGPINDSVLKSNNNDSITDLFNNTADIEEKILSHIFEYHSYYFSVLFDILQNIENLNEICLNFDIPHNVKNKVNYMMVIIKFILNCLFYFFNNIKIKKICILSPRTILDKRQFPIIDQIINGITISNNSLLTDLSLHFQFYQISNINNFINTRLEILNIGDLDLKTFKSLCDNLCSPYFNINSSLKKLSIGLLNYIINFNTEMKILLRRLFNIKIRNFVSLSLYTNLIINDDFDYDYFLQILNNNWISEYTIILNKKSKKIQSKDVEKLLFYVPHNLETKLLCSDDIIKFQNNPSFLEIDKNKDFYDVSYWYLKHLFEHVYVDKMKNEKRTKSMIMGILKYLYFLKAPTINIPM